jgi:hypothetical protein
VGAAIGAAAGGMTGKVLADLVDPKMEDEFWRKNWSDRKYIDGGFTYDQDWGPAYRYGVDAYTRYPDTAFTRTSNPTSPPAGMTLAVSRAWIGIVLSTPPVTPGSVFATTWSAPHPAIPTGTESKAEQPR